MIKKLRIKFIWIAMCSVTAVLIIIVGSINLANYNRINSSAEVVLDVLTENRGVFPRPEGHPKGKPRALPPETPYETRYFTAMLDSSGNIIALNTRSIAAVTDDEAVEYAGRVWEKGRQKGYEGNYKYSAVETEEGTFIVFLDCSRDLSFFHSFLSTSLLVSATGIVSVFILVLIFSKIAVRPVAESYEKQKRFITDAGHEIKTPLTIIDANAEVLEMNGGENEWTRSIKNQVKRLSALTAGLISLSRMDEERDGLVMTDFSLSDAVSETIKPFLALAKANHQAFLLDIQKNISQRGNEAAIRQLVSILADNAIRHGSQNGTISVTLRKQGKYSELIFFNLVDYIEKGSLDILFERFYRRDPSRSAETGGYGIGLSIAKAIVAAHKGRISAESRDGNSILITVQL